MEPMIGTNTLAVSGLSKSYRNTIRWVISEKRVIREHLNKKGGTHEDKRRICTILFG
jgi:hypothetical protein